MNKPLPRYALAWLAVVILSALGLFGVFALGNTLGFSGATWLNLGYVLPGVALLLAPAYLLRGTMLLFSQRLHVRLIKWARLPLLVALIQIVILVLTYLFGMRDGIYIRSTTEMTLMPLVLLQTAVTVGAALVPAWLLRRLASRSVEGAA